MTSDIAAQLNHALSGRYEILREIGRGGMATVYLARDIRHSRNVALKVLDPELGAVLGAERFLSEIRVTAILQHPNLLPLFDSGEADGLLFYVMPFIEGETLRARLERERQLPIDDAVRIATAVAGALGYAHGHGVIHRDLKPENILLQHGQPVVADFGIALAVSNAGGTRVTQTGLSLGTPQYMSPEQATGDRAIDARSDIYSLGAVTYEMLAGEPPHTGTTAQAIVAKLMTEEARSISVLRRLVPEHVDEAVARALEKLPADRFATAAQFADALNGKAVAAPTRGRTRAGGLSRSSLENRIGTGLVLATLVTLIVLVLQRREAPATAAGFALRYAIPPGENERDLASLGVAISQDGRQVAYATHKGGISTIMLKRATDLAAHPIAEGNWPLFSPDGQSMLIVESGDIKRLNLTNGSVRTLAPGNGFQGYDWGIDDSGHDLIVVSFDNRLMTIPVAGGAPKPLISPRTETAEASLRVPHVMPDGRHVIFALTDRKSHDARIAVASIADGTIKTLDLQGTPLGFVDDYLILGRSPQGLFAVRFDPRRLDVTGEAVPVLDSMAQYSTYLRVALSHSGSIVYRKGAVGAQLVTLDALQPNAEPRLVLAEPKEYSYPRFAPDGKRIAVSALGPGSRDLWIFDMTSGTPTRVSDGQGRSERAEWTPDGRQLLYWTNEGANQGAVDGLVMRNADLSGAPLHIGRAGEGVISPDGRTLLYRGSTPSSTTESDIWYRTLAGDTTPHVLVATPRNDFAARFSSDGKWVAYGSAVEGAGQVYVQPFPPTGAVHKVTADGGSTPVWSPDGRKIYYVGANGHLWVANITLTPTFAVTSRAEVLPSGLADRFMANSVVHANFDVSPDGKRILFVRRTADQSQLVVVHDWKYEVRERMKTAARP